MMYRFIKKPENTNTVWKYGNNNVTRERSNSIGEWEDESKYYNDPYLGKLYKFIYPPDSEYYWYRNGKIGHLKNKEENDKGLEFKFYKFFILNLLMAIAGSGSLVGIFIYSLHYTMLVMYYTIDSHSISIEHLHKASEANINVTALEFGIGPKPEYISYLLKNPIFILGWMFASGLSTLFVYVLGAEYLLKEFYIKQAGNDETWKCQPFRYLNKEVAIEEKLSGCMNSFLAGFLGLALFFLDQEYHFLHLYYDLSRGYIHFFGGALFCFFWIDLWSYLAHGLLHFKFFYLLIHKWHHRYVTPTPYSAFAMHPIEFITFQSAGIACLCFFEIHVVAFLCVVVYLAYHNQLDHSGIHFESDNPFGPTSKFHDDHHAKFHTNFGLQLVLWDWLFGTLRKKSRMYSENLFVGEQDVSSTTSNSKKQD